jgi:hypothetical protein
LREGRDQGFSINYSGHHLERTQLYWLREKLHNQGKAQRTKRGSSLSTQVSALVGATACERRSTQKYDIEAKRIRHGTEICASYPFRVVKLLLLRTLCSASSQLPILLRLHYRA